MGGGTIFGVPNEPPTKTYRMEGGEREKEKEKLVAREEKENKRVEVMKWEGEKGGLRKEVPLW